MIGQRASFGRENLLDIYYFGASEIWRDKKGGIFREWYYKYAVIPKYTLVLE
jgi:hypothetical protein